MLILHDPFSSSDEPYTVIWKQSVHDVPGEVEPPRLMGLTRDAKCGPGCINSTPSEGVDCTVPTTPYTYDNPP